MSKYPKKNGAVYTAQMGLRVEPELKHRLHTLKKTIDDDVVEAIRMKLRELADELEAEQTEAS